MSTIERKLTKANLLEANQNGYFLDEGKLPVVARGLEDNNCYFGIARDDETNEVIIVGYEVQKDRFLQIKDGYQKASVSFYDENDDEELTAEEIISKFSLK